MLKILVIVDEKKSSKNQCEALISQLKLKRKLIYKSIIIKKNLFHWMPNFLIFYILKIFSFFFKIKIKNIDMILSCGRIAAPYNLIYCEKKKSYNFHILDPYLFRKKFKKIIIPNHDYEKLNNHENIIFTIGTLTNEKNKNFDKRLLPLKKNITCLVGGSGKSSKLNVSDISVTIEILNKLSDSYNIVYCFSRRTPENIKNYIINNKVEENDFYPKASFNPYEILLNESSTFFVTEDSVGMISDALSTGKPTYLIRVKKIKKKLKNFSNFLIEKKYLSIYSSNSGILKYQPLNEAKVVAENILNDYDKFTTCYETKSIDQGKV